MVVVINKIGIREMENIRFILKACPWSESYGPWATVIPKIIFFFQNWIFFGEYPSLNPSLNFDNWKTWSQKREFEHFVFLGIKSTIKSAIKMIHYCSFLFCYFLLLVPSYYLFLPIGSLQK